MTGQVRLEGEKVKKYGELVVVIVFQVTPCVLPINVALADGVKLPLNVGVIGSVRGPMDSVDEVAVKVTELLIVVGPRPDIDHVIE